MSDLEQVYVLLDKINDSTDSQLAGVGLHLTLRRWKNSSISSKRDLVSTLSVKMQRKNWSKLLQSGGRFTPWPTSAKSHSNFWCIYPTVFCCIISRNNLAGWSGRCRRCRVGAIHVSESLLLFVWSKHSRAKITQPGFWSIVHHREHGQGFWKMSQKLSGMWGKTSKLIYKTL